VEIYLTVKLHWFFCLRLGFVPASFIFYALEKKMGILSQTSAPVYEAL
jgi:hypothetical protein